MAPDPDRSPVHQGHVPLDEALADLPLSAYQHVELRVLEGLIAALRPFYWLLRRLRRRPFAVDENLDEYVGAAAPSRGSRTAESHGGDYLTAAQIADYERDGVLGPLPLLSADEAAELRQWLVATHEADWHGRHPIGTEAVKELKRNGLWAINHGGLWQERNFSEPRHLAQHPVLAQRVASLLGDDVVAWRTQVFVVNAHTRGTFWHSSTTFAEDGTQPALTAPADVHPSMVNVSVWVALEDVDRTNASLRIMRGSHRDIRLDTLIRRLTRDRLGFVMALDRRQRRNALLALRYSGDIFMAGQVAFEFATDRIPDLYRSVDAAEFPMKAGECLLFSSTNLHGSWPNLSGEARLAMGVRYTSADVGIYEGQDTIPYATGAGTTDVDAHPLAGGIDVHDADGPIAGRRPARA